MSEGGYSQELPTHAFPVSLAEPLKHKEEWKVKITIEIEPINSGMEEYAVQEAYKFIKNSPFNYWKIHIDK